MRSTQEWKELYQQFLQNTCSTAEVRELMAYFEAHGANGQLDEDILRALTIDNLAIQADDADMDQALMRVDARIVSGLKARKRWHLFKQVAVAAAVLLAMGVSFYFLISPPSPAEIGHRETAGILRDHYKASLQLAGGGEITLRPDAEGLVADPCGIHYTDGTTLLSNAYPDRSGAIYSIKTPAGGLYTLILPDGSRVTLNAGSSLSFPLSFNGRSRAVELTGEGYFLVAEGKKQKAKSGFVVHTEGQAVRVLGTAFNVSAYREDGEIRTTLFHGAVQVLAKDSLLLHPGEQAVLNENGILSKNAVGPENNSLAWSEGYFNFSGKTAVQMLHELARWYGLEIVYQGQKPSFSFQGKLRRDQTISDIIHIFDMYHIPLKVAGNKLIVP